MGDELLTRVRDTIAAHRLFEPKARIVVAVSGGPDSLALLHLLVALREPWKLVVHAAHLDHALRETSGEDAEFVRQAAGRWGVPVTVERRQVRARCAERRWSLEDGARRIRYEFLREVAARQSADRVAVAHTADDQAETVLLRLLRGAGVAGLGGIPIKRPLEPPGWVVRPLLKVWRSEILAYLQRQQLAARHDETNQDLRFVRNRIRHQLLPLLERDYNPQIRPALVQLAAQCASDAAYLQDAAERQWRRTVKRHRVTNGNSSVAIPVTQFLRQPKALQRQLLRRTIQHLQGDLRAFEFRHWLETERLFLERPEGTVLDLPGGVQFRRDRDRVLGARGPSH